MATKVLLVEDDNNLREIYEARLAAEGYEISTAKDGEDALAVAKQTKPDLIISDVMMPRISGFEMLDVLRNTDGLKETKIIMLTALGQAEDKTRADNLGADRYLVRSQVTLEDIVKAADELIHPESYPADTAAPSSPPPTSSSAGNIPQASTTAPVSPDVAAITHQAPEPPVMPDTPQPPTPIVETPQPAPTVVAPEPSPSQEATPQVSTPSPTTAAPASMNEPFTSPQPTFSTPQPDTQAATVPVAEPLQTPLASPVPQPPSMPLPQPVAVDNTQSASQAAAGAQSTSQEAATVDQQIKDFENAPAPTPQAVTPDPSSQESNNEALITTAANTLQSSQPADAPAPDLTAPTTGLVFEDPPEAEPAQVHEPQNQPQQQSSTIIPGKKVIEPPVESQNQPDIDTLLVQEQMKENQVTGVTGQAVISNVAEQPVKQQPQQAPHPTEPPAAPPGGVFTPNQGGSADNTAL